MTPAIEAFLKEVREAPEFIAGVAADPQKLEDFSAIERGIEAIERLADRQPIFLDDIDRLSALVSRSDLSIKQRLLESIEIMRAVRDAVWLVH
jgi:hypothetical protein